MISICHVQVLPILSGVQRAMLEIFRHLDRRRYAPEVVCQAPGPLSDELARLDIACHFVPALGRAIRPWKDARAYRELSEFFRRRRFALVHTHSSKPGILARVAARRAGVPWVVHHVHSFAFHQFSSPLAYAVYSRLERWAGAYCDRVLFVNHEDRELAIDRGLLPAAKCLTIHNGVDLSEFNPSQRQRDRGAFRTAHGLADDETVILFMGRLDTPKQPLLLPEIAARLTQLLPAARWRLVVAGAGPLEEALRKRIGELGVGHRVSLVGWQHPSAPAFHGADLCLQPSLWEGLPLSVVEAHAAGLPVVGSNVKGIREVVTPESGRLCRPHHADDYAQALARLIVDGQLRQRLGAAARQRAWRHFDGAVNMRRIGELYDQWLGSAPARPALRPAA